MNRSGIPSFQHENPLELFYILAELFYIWPITRRMSFSYILAELFYIWPIQHRLKFKPLVTVTLN